MRYITLTLATLIAQASLAVDPVAVPAEAEHWERADRITFMNYMNEPAMALSGGPYAVKDADFADGRIDVDVAMHGVRGFLGIVFRYQSASDYELFYLRPHKTGLPDAVQYTPAINGLTGWQLYADEHALSSANLPEDRWVHVTVEFEGRRATIYLDGAAEPALVVPDLKHGLSRGAVGLWGGDMGHFTNFTYTVSNAVSDENGLRTAATKWTPDPLKIHNWELSRVYEAAVQSPRERPAEPGWQSVATESPGFVNISRYHPKLARADREDKTTNLDVVYARTTIYSDRDQVKRLWFGASDDVVVSLNGINLIESFSSFSHRYPFALGIVGLNNDAVYLPLKRGNNELVFAVSESFGGWGFTARFDDLDGVRINTK